MDRYSLTARVYPMILFFFPAVTAVVMFIDDVQNYYQSFLNLGIIGVLAYLFSQLGRDAGKKKEADLWNNLGGAPTTQLFRWSDNVIDRHTKLRNHNRMMELCPVDQYPDSILELNDPLLADQIYAAWTRFIIGHTRDVRAFPLLFKENMAYGFRRNLWGLKPFAIALIIITMVLLFGFSVFRLNSWVIWNLSSTLLICESLLFVYLMFWLLIVNKNWVLVPAFEYAERLHEAISKI